MVIIDYITREEIKKHNPNWPQTSIKNIHSWMAWIRKNALFNLIGRKSDVNKIYLYAKNLYEAKYQLLINKRKGLGLKEYNDFKGFIQYSNYMDGIYENIEK